MTVYSSKQWFVKERTGDNLDVDETFELATKELSTNDLKEGDILTKSLLFSNDMKGGKVSAGISREAWTQVFCHKTRIERFIVLQFVDQLLKALTDLGTWMAEGKIHLIKDIWEAGVEDLPKGMLKLLKGENTGKLITKVVHS
ncbi:uncharacterized protein DFL_008820 [Arthrobotrys flagrans]|uniref:Alcohol dehydrogenase-like C-terminal domain-containing protein n=1 Tax=Arthrobotrys flagrans TaxID=97331 RepID=A0A436ZPZ8_ARTFL|nr:hypothetical protein DFL_008820 [Arthrobotrys flagrans]